MPAGEYLMEDFHYAGGLQAVNKALLEKDLLHGDQVTVNGKTVIQNCAEAQNYNEDVIRPMDKALTEDGGIAVLRGNLAPDGCVLKPSAASKDLMTHKGKAVVFESIEDYHERIDAPDLDVDKDSILVLKGCGPKGYPGMPEVGNMSLPAKLLKEGVEDMVRISDARMSGTAYGTVILHVAPESAAGGPLAFIQNGDEIDLDVNARKLDLLVSDEEMDRRRAAWTPPPPRSETGYQRLYHDHVEQADKGADWGILSGVRGSDVPRDSH
jgi:dihydroxy-acid dehydratase